MKSEINEVNDTGKQGVDEEQAACGPGCDCEADGSGGRIRWVVGVVILIVAGGLVARAITKDDGADTQETDAAFAAVIPATDESTPQETPPSTSEKADVAIAGQELSTLADLNAMKLKRSAEKTETPRAWQSLRNRVSTEVRQSSGKRTSSSTDVEPARVAPQT